jgi:hypothetical protein
VSKTLQGKQVGHFRQLLATTKTGSKNCLRTSNKANLQSIRRIVSFRTLLNQEEAVTFTFSYEEENANKKHGYDTESVKF